MLNVWSLSVPRRANDPPDHLLTLLDFELPRSFNDNPVLRHQSPHTPPLGDCLQSPRGQRVLHINANLLEFFRHPGPAIVAQAQPRLLLDMRQNHHAHVLPPAGWTAPERPQSARADIHHPAQPIDREGAALFFDEPETRGFRPAKNWGAFVGKTVPRTVF